MSHCVSSSYCTTSRPWPCPFSFPAAFCPLNQSTARFREEVNTLVLWLGPFLQRGLYNWKALCDYFKTLVGTNFHVWEWGSPFFLLHSLIAKQVRYLWLVLFCDYHALPNIQKIKQKLKTIVCCLTEAVICPLCDKIRMGNFTIEGKKRGCTVEQVLHRPCVLHTALQSSTANIPQTKINVVSLWVKSLNKQKYQQSASSLFPKVVHNRLFVELVL